MTTEEMIMHVIEPGCEAIEFRSESGAVVWRHSMKVEHRPNQAHEAMLLRPVLKLREWFASSAAAIRAATIAEMRRELERLRDTAAMCLDKSGAPQHAHQYYAYMSALDALASKDQKEPQP